MPDLTTFAKAITPGSGLSAAFCSGPLRPRSRPMRPSSCATATLPATPPLARPPSRTWRSCATRRSSPGAHPRRRLGDGLRRWPLTAPSMMPAARAPSAAGLRPDQDAWRCGTRCSPGRDHAGDRHRHADVLPATRDRPTSRSTASSTPSRPLFTELRPAPRSDHAAASPRSPSACGPRSPRRVPELRDPASCTALDEMGAAAARRPLRHHPSRDERAQHLPCVVRHVRTQPAGLLGEPGSGRGVAPHQPEGVGVRPRDGQHDRVAPRPLVLVEVDAVELAGEGADRPVAAPLGRAPTSRRRCGTPSAGSRLRPGRRPPSRCRRTPIEEGPAATSTSWARRAACGAFSSTSPFDPMYTDVFTFGQGLR